MFIYENWYNFPKGMFGYPITSGYRQTELPVTQTQTEMKKETTEPITTQPTQPTTEINLFEKYKRFLTIAGVSLFLL